MGKQKSQHTMKSLWTAYISQKTLACVCVLLLVVMLIPLIVIAIYNYPADDDFKMVLGASTAWIQTGSLFQVLKAIVANTVDIYQVWQGNFVSTALFSFTPMVFNINLYFLSSWAILAFLCLSIAYLLKGLTEKLLHAGQAVFWIVYTVIMVLVLQFMPSIGYSVYWHNGGMYTVVACTLFLLQGVLLRCTLPQTRRRCVLRGVCAAVLGFMLGGSFFGPMLGALVLLALEASVAMIRKSRNRVHCMLALGFCLLSLMLSVTAPGNALRQERTGETLSVGAAILTAVLDSFDVAGKWIAPQWLAALMLLVPVLWRPLRQSSYSFAHPFGVFVMLYGLFCATLVPGIYTGFGYTTERYFNTIYFYFLFMSIGGVLYAEGALIRMLERKLTSDLTAPALLNATSNIGKRFVAWYLAICIALLALGGFSYTIMNTASVSATKSLITGEAAKFRDDMAQRQEYIRVTDSDVVEVKPLDSQPYVFKNDKLPWQGIYGRVRYMKWYFELFYNAEQLEKQRGS